MGKLLQTLTKKPKCDLLLRMPFLLLITLALALFGFYILNMKSPKLEAVQSSSNLAVRELDNHQAVKLSRTVYVQPNLLRACREDVLVLTPWLAPIIWEGTFDIDILNKEFLVQKVTIGLTVFAVKKYIIFLKQFLETAERNFMVGHRVNYYIFTDQPDSIPHLTLPKGRQMVVLQIQSYSRWEDNTMHRMEMISNFSEHRFLHEVDYLVCLDVDMIFINHVGVEILSSLFGTIHPFFFGLHRSSFNYERRPQSQAHISRDEGDFYYVAAIFGGTVREVYRLTKACHQAMMVDQANGIEAVWHEESHLNKYLLYHKPTKVLSMEYFWSKNFLQPEQLQYLPKILKKIRFVTLPKDSQSIRQ
ncbi:histo-blood group ABO system transferase-like [Dasypus novemcinctus]|uniref:histo-blood group ABO system transferase-like n=1 Tax=Dasypus novemcinctus TaxID=9361 RepID=UPI000328EFB8|nr:histo-blood group ABO system transferase-like [Dasypus novemcinctus]